MAVAKQHRHGQICCHSFSDTGHDESVRRFGVSLCPTCLTMSFTIYFSHDEYKVFAKPVSESEAPGYYERIKNPMDFGTMRKKVLDGAYGDSRDAMELLYKDFRQTFDNCLIYNDEGDVTEEASRILAFLPEAFAAACAAAMK